MSDMSKVERPRSRVRARALRLAPLVALAISSVASTARAESMIAKFIRIDPEPTTDEKKGTPVIPMVVELGVPTPINSFAEGCFTGGTGNKVTQTAITCMSNKISKEGYAKQFEFPKENAQVISIVGGEPRPMEIVDVVPFKDATAPNAGVAWLILMDASSSLGSRWDSMQETATALINSMGPNDAVQVRIMDDKSVRASTKWLSAGGKGKALNTIKGISTTFQSSAAVDSLISRIEKETMGGFQSLFKDGVEGAEEGVMPLIQSVVILSDGGDSSAQGFAGGTKAQLMRDKLIKGDIGIADMRLPVPIISIWFPQNDWNGILAATRRENEYSWMSNMATPEVGGYFDIIQDGETGKGKKIAAAVRARFDGMHYVEAKASCLDTSGEQKFKLVFEDTKSKIVPDTWDKVPIAFNFTKWLLDIDKKKTEESASKDPLKPGESFQVFGDFCWGSNTGAAEAYFVTEADAAEVKKAAADKTGKAAKALLQSLAAKGQKAETVAAAPLSAKFKVPTTPALFENKADNFSLNVVILDNKALRVSARDKSGLLVLKAQKAPINKLLIIGAVGGGVVLILLIAILARGGGGGGRAKRRKGGAPPAPAPMPGQPPGPPPGPVASGGAQPGSFGAPAQLASPPQTAFAPPQQVATAFAPPQPAATAFAPPQQVATAFAPPQQVATAFAPPQTAFAPPQTAFAPPQTAFAPPQAVPTAFAPPPAAATAFAPPQQPPVAATAFAPPQTAFAPPQPMSYEAAPPQPTFTPNPGTPPGTPAPMGGGLKAQHKGGTSFPTTCPNPGCRKSVLVPPGGTAQCAFCGTLVDASGSAVSAIPATQNFGLTGAASESAAAAAAAAVAAVAGMGGTVALQQGLDSVRSLLLQGSTGTFRVLAGIESRVGRDGGMCSIALNEPRVSGVHATLKLEGGLLYVRDDQSHNGTFVNGNRIAPGTWIPVPGGSQLRFGPVEFVVRHES